MKPTFYLTTPIYYPNARPHVGSAYTTIVCDVLARYKRMCGYDVAYLTGTDEHGEKLERAASAAGKTPKEFVAEKRKLFVDLWEKLGIPVKVYPEADADSLRFIYTDHPDHEKTVRRMLLLAKKNNFITKRRYEGRYCIFDERYVSDNTEPVNCDICGRPAELISEENYFFELSRFGPSAPGKEDGLLFSFYDKHPNFVQPDYRMNEVKSFVRSGLRDISISRKRIKWGFPFPLSETENDPEQVVYVWYDALSSYMTGIGYAEGEGDFGNTEFKKYWRNVPGESELVHMIGKDILRFHAVYWPAFIMAAYPDEPEMLPSTVFAHGWIYYEQDKMSKSKGNVVYPEPIVDAFNSFGAPGNDALRYYLLREAPFGQDTSFSYEGLIQRYNSDLANGLGNLAKRTLTMLHQYNGGLVPSPGKEGHRTAAWDLSSLAAGYPSSMDALDFSFALTGLWSWLWGKLSDVDGLIAKTKPWELAKSTAPADREVLESTLYAAIETLRVACLFLAPIMPTTSKRLWRLLGQPDNIEYNPFDGQVFARQIEPGTVVGEPETLFPRLDKAKTLAKLDELSEADRNRDKTKETSKHVESENAKPAAAPESPSPTAESQAPAAAPAIAPESAKITIDDFVKVDLRAGEIKSAERIPGATKLLKLLIDIGTEVRQICAGIAEHYEPEALVGKKVVIVANLAPRKMRGVESNGMIVAASLEGGKPVLASFGEEVPNGARLK